jgi:hypothetical protein
VNSDFEIPFRRRLSQALSIQWEHIKDEARRIVVPDSCDSVIWGLTANRVFTTKSLYQNLERNIFGANNKWIWKSKLSLKIKIFMWQLFWDAILTRDKLKRRN